MYLHLLNHETQSRLVDMLTQSVGTQVGYENEKEKWLGSVPGYLENGTYYKETV